MSDGLRVARIADLLTRYPEQKITRSRVATAVSTRQAQVNGRTLTRLWPYVEARVGQAGFYAVRPIGRLDYGVLATANPSIGLLSLKDREQHVVTRLRHDVLGEMLQRIVESDGRSAVSAALQLERARVYLSAYDNNQLDLTELFDEAVRGYNNLPWVTLTEADQIPWEA